MANLLADPSRWTSRWGDGPPPNEWVDGAYRAQSEPWSEGALVLKLQGVAEEGDTITGTINGFANEYGYDGYLNLFEDGEDTDYVQAALGGSTDFSFTPAPGRSVELILANYPGGNWPSSYYGLYIEIVPGGLEAVDDVDDTVAGRAVTTAVLANDTLRDQPVTLADLAGVPTITRQPDNGTAQVNADGTITYTPNAGFSGVDTYEYEISTSPTCASVAFLSGSGNNYQFDLRDLFDMPVDALLEPGFEISIDFDDYRFARYVINEYPSGTIVEMTEGDYVYGEDSGTGMVEYVLAGTDGSTKRACIHWYVSPGV